MDPMHVAEVCLPAVTHISMKIYISCNQHLQPAKSLGFIGLTVNQL